MRSEMKKAETESAFPFILLNYHGFSIHIFDIAGHVPAIHRAAAANGPPG